MATRNIDKVVEEGRFFAVISYISFLCIVSLVLKPDNKFAQFHTKIGLVLFMLEVIVFLLSIIGILSWIKAAGLVIFTLISLWGIIQAMLGRYCRLPLISDIADKVII
ncbi:MAG: hypothetical protein NTZ92_03495 [Candidatus Omnitrophica bacterium]|nr:hypothetical protein [Candidatus Omnitrophota bacterium]